MKRPMTLLDVARAANVSKTTASNVFSRPDRVRPVLRQRVEAAARSLGYEGPDPKGRMLSFGKVNAIGVVPSAAFGISLFFKNATAQAFLAGVAGVCEEHGVGLSLVSGRDDQRAWGLRSALVDGFIFSSIERAEVLEQARSRGLPFVVMDVDCGPDVNWIGVEDRDGARQATRHLLALGHRRFVIASPLHTFRAPVFHPPGTRGRRLVAGSPGIDERIAGIAEALAEAGIAIDDVPIIEACGTPEEEAAFGNGAAMLLDRAPEATAVLAQMDGLALAILDQARRRGISVPRDLSIVGFDDIAEATFADPPLTTVASPVMEKGRTAARMLLEGGPPRHVVLPVKLMVRGSTGPAPRR